MKIQNILAFTLIELLIVISIIGILSAAAAPAYNKYLIKAKITELFSLSLPYKLQIMEDLASGVVPKLTEQNTKNTILKDIILKEPKLTGATLEFIVDKDKIGVDNQDLVVRFIASTQENFITWDCQVQNGFKDYMPNNCKTTFD